MEAEANSHIPFLDMLVSFKSDGTFGHCVYRKPTHIDRYLHATSHHHPAQKQAVLNALAYRANRTLKRFSNKEHFKEEKAHLTNALEKNGYKRDFIIEALRGLKNRHSHLQRKMIHIERTYLS